MEVTKKCCGAFTDIPMASLNVLRLDILERHVNHSDPVGCSIDERTSEHSDVVMQTCLGVSCAIPRQFDSRLPYIRFSRGSFQADS